MENIVMLNSPAEPSAVTSSPERGATAPGVIPGMTGRSLPREQHSAAEHPADPREPPRAKRRTYPRRRFGIPVVYALFAAAGTALGVFLAASAPEGTDFTESLLCGSGEFLQLTLNRLLWGLAFLTAEYITGYFALGGVLVWLAPLACGLGTGAALTGAFAESGVAALKLVPTCVSMTAAVVAGARASGDMSSRLLRLVSTGRNGMAAVVSDTPAAGEYTLQFLVYFAVAAGSAIAEAAVRTLSQG